MALAHGGTFCQPALCISLQCPVLWKKMYHHVFMVHRVKYAFSTEHANHVTKLSVDKVLLIHVGNLNLMWPT